MKRIKSIEVLNSSFFKDGFRVDFSDKLNCIMGGRGTGKSTLLQFIKATIDNDAEEDRNTFNILRSNLDGGKIILHIETEDGNNYRIEKIMGEEPQPYLQQSNQYTAYENIKNEIPCDIFPAQMIEEIGKNSDERLKLIDRMLIGTVEGLKEKIELQKIELEKNAKDIRSINLTLNQRKERLKDYGNAEEDLKNHKENQPPDIKEEEKTEFDKQDAAEKVRGAESRYLKKLSEILSLNIEKGEDFKNELEKILSFLSNTSSFINKDIVEGLTKDISATISNLKTVHIGNLAKLSESTVKIEKASTKLKEVHDKQHNQFVQLKQNLEKHKVYYDKLNLLTKRTDEKTVIVNDIKESTDKRTLLKNQRDKLVKELNKTKKEIHDFRLGKINDLNKQFEKSRIKITLAGGGITDEYEDALRNALKGHNLRYNTLIPYIANNFTPDKLAEVIHSKDIEKLKTVSGIDVERSEVIMNALYETDAIYHIETIYCPDLPDFHLKVDKEEDHGKKSVDLYKKSDELSTGQRCTTVLPIVFAISNNPLIIDQPEDNLDNKYISETIQQIVKESKGKRQLIFITHNPNIPVLSDSEHNIFLKYEDRQTNVLTEGNITKVKDEILSLLEGGREAFELRDNLYKN